MPATSDDCDYLEILRAVKREVDPARVSDLVEFRSSYVVLRTLGLAAATVAIWTGALTLPLWFLIVAFPLMVVVQQEMLIWVHEGAHRTLFRKTSLNDFWVSFWFASPLGVNFETYRRSHMTHHSRLASAEDGDRWTYELYIRNGALRHVLVKAALGFYGFSRAFKKYATGKYNPKHAEIAYPPTPSYLLFMLLWNGAFIAASVLTGRWFVFPILWLVPLFSVAILITILRTIAEHQPMNYKGADPIDPVTRTTLCGWLERRLMFPLNFNFHLEHHLFPQVPFFNLPRMHRELSERRIFDQYPQVLQGSALTRVIDIWHGRRASAPAKPAAE